MVSFLVDIFWVTDVGFCQECGLCAVFVYHSDSIITGVKSKCKGLWSWKQYVSCMFHVCFSF